MIILLPAVTASNKGVTKQATGKPRVGSSGRLNCKQLQELPDLAGLGRLGSRVQMPTSPPRKKRGNVKLKGFVQHGLLGFAYISLYMCIYVDIHKCFNVSKEEVIGGDIWGLSACVSQSENAAGEAVL